MNYKAIQEHLIFHAAAELQQEYNFIGNLSYDSPELS